jgi:hypothetical protein
MVNWIDMFGQAFLGQARREADAEMGFDGSIGRRTVARREFAPRNELETNRAQTA